VGFGEDDLRALAGVRSFERGLGYLDAVTGLEVGEGSVTAVVHGTDIYEVEFSLGGDTGISGWCDCPYGQEGNFCKHCVAVRLTVLREAEAVPRQRSAARARASGLQAWLTALSRDELLALVREQIGRGRTSICPPRGGCGPTLTCKDTSRKGVMLPIHWGTFKLAAHAWAEPGEWTMDAAEDAGQVVAAPRPGEPFEPAGKLPVDPWWRAVSAPIAHPWRRPKVPTAAPAVQDELDLAGGV